MNVTQIPAPVDHEPGRDSAFAWASLLLFPLSVAAAFLVGEGLASLLSDWPDDPDPALWQILASSVPALVVFALPAWPAWHFGMRAHRNGARSGRVAAWTGVLLAAGFVLLNVSAYFLGG